MKLRIRDNTLRFRLGQGEVRQLVEDGTVACALRFGDGPDQAVGYAVKKGGRATPGVDYRDGTITVYLTDAHIAVLDAGEEEGVCFEAGRGHAVRVSVERDFQCLKPRPEEDESDAFANPAAGDSC